MSYRVALTVSAEEHVRSIDEWWRTNRADSPERFRIELEEAIASLRHAPLPAPRARKRPPVYRILLRVTRNHVYFHVDEDAAVVRVLAVWGGPRRRGPPLPR